MSQTRRTFLNQSLAAGLGWATLSQTTRLLGEEVPFPKPMPIHDVVREQAANAPLKMLFNGSTPEEFAAWQRTFRAQLSELLGDSQPPAKWEIEEESRREFEDHTRLELLLHADGTPTLPVYLLLPKTANRETPLPAVVCVHGHGKYGNHPIVGRDDLEGVAQSIRGAHYDYGLQFVRRGYVVAAPCLIPFGRRLDQTRTGGDDPCAVLFVRMLALGQLPITANLRDIRWSIDLLQSRVEVASDRIGCAGLSYGGRMTMLATAMDERIRVACISGALNLLQERIGGRYSCGSQVIPGLLKYGDYSEIGSLIAPRPVVWEVGEKDGLISPKWAELFKQRLQRAYTAHNQKAALQFDNYNGGHRWNGEKAYPLFDDVLKSS